MCGICFIKKCNKKPRPAGANKSHDQPQQHPMPVYEDVLSSFKDVKQREQILELKQNVAYSTWCHNECVHKILISGIILWVVNFSGPQIVTELSTLISIGSGHAVGERNYSELSWSSILKLNSSLYHKYNDLCYIFFQLYLLLGVGIYYAGKM